ncbi:polysaccharide deacetylase family protein [Paracrocinitomix mangrovi]|uniref:polysaccharide deacetylase family protein n=1 Tax=Paracrocinitomix mangrovi TaxID=2862509 RepID=UPI001C8EF7D6|nr:polysaccharide deacetylase family protein [Paracrocinitomix mangrovi]UKN02814.1 polysaccharide deacetylase family protein [Paracrocinitomix mangrovi]
MRFNRLYHTKGHFVKTIIGNVYTAIFGLGISKGDLLVLNYHSTPEKLHQSFIKQITYLENKFTFLNPSDLEEFMKGKLDESKRYVLLTFDDGLLNNLKTIKYLNNKGVYSILFVVPGFIDSEDGKAFYIKNIRPVINANIDNGNEDFVAINWDKLAELYKNGNVIGAHTHNHILTKDLDHNSIVDEIVNCKSIIESKLNCKVEMFCSPNNTLMSVGDLALKLIQDNYKFHFTTIPGSNSVHKNSLFIKRVNVESFWTKGAFKFALSKVERNRYKNERSTYEKLIENSKK